MRMFIKLLVIALVSIILGAGCLPEEGGTGHAQKKKVKFDPGNFSTYRANDVLVQVGDRKLTKREIDRLVDLRLRTLRFSLPADRRDQMVNRMSVQVPLLVNAAPAFRAQTAMLNWAKTNNVTVTEEDIRTFEMAFMRNCRYIGNNFSSFLNQFTKDEQKTIHERIRVEAICENVKQRFLRDHPDAVKPTNTSEFMTFLTNYNHAAEATNALVWAKATNLWNEAKKGADFAKLAGENTEDLSHPEGGAWGTFRLSDLADDGLLDQVVAALKVGEVSAPVEADNGLNVIKLLAVSDERGNPVDDASRRVTSRYTLSRIFLRLPEIYEIPSEEEATKAIRRKAEDDAFLKFVNGLMAVDGVLYPNGEKVFENARKMSKMPMMFQQEGAQSPKK